MSAEKHPEAGRVYLPDVCRSCSHAVPAVVVDDKGNPELVEASPMPQGKPIMGSGRIASRDEKGIYRIVADINLSGPPQVATKSYRDGWDRTFDRSLN